MENYVSGLPCDNLCRMTLQKFVYAGMSTCRKCRIARQALPASTNKTQSGAVDKNHDSCDNGSQAAALSYTPQRTLSAIRLAPVRRRSLWSRSDDRDRHPPI